MPWSEDLFRARVLECGKRKGLNSLNEIAKAAGLDRKYFREDAPPEGRNTVHLMRLSDTLEADPGYLIGYTQPNQPPTLSPSEAFPEDDVAVLGLISILSTHVFASVSRRRYPDRPISRIVKKLIEVMDEA